MKKAKETKIRMTKKRIVETVSDVAGEDVAPVINMMLGEKDVSEFDMSEKLNTEIHEVRNILYRLYSHNLATYFKKKDREKGWYVGYWTFNNERVKDLFYRVREQKLNKLKHRLSQEQNDKDNYFMCTNACIRANFDKAAELLFKCPECNQILSSQDNSKTIDNLKSRIQQLQSEA